MVTIYIAENATFMETDGSLTYSQDILLDSHLSQPFQLFLRSR
jgi:hypothetical protein